MKDDPELEKDKFDATAEAAADFWHRTKSIWVAMLILWLIYTFL